MLCTASNTFRIPTYSELYLFIYIQTYLRLLRHIHAYWSIFKAYSGLFRHIQSLGSRHMHMKPSLFVILEYSESFHNCISMHIRNPVIFTKKNIYKNHDKHNKEHHWCWSDTILAVWWLVVSRYIIFIILLTILHLHLNCYRNYSSSGHLAYFIHSVWCF